MQLALISNTFSVIPVAQNNGHYAIQGHSKSQILVPTESPYAPDTSSPVLLHPGHPCRSHDVYDNDCGHLPPIIWPYRASVSLQSVSGRSRFPALQCGTIFRLTSHQRRHSRFSDSASSRFCSLSLIRTFTPDSQSLRLCGPCNNWHYLGHTKVMMMQCRY